VVCTGVNELDVEVLVRLVVEIDRRVGLRNKSSIASPSIGAIMVYVLSNFWSIWSAVSKARGDVPSNIARFARNRSK